LVSYISSSLNSLLKNSNNPSLSLFHLPLEVAKTISLFLCGSLGHSRKKKHSNSLCLSRFFIGKTGKKASFFPSTSSQPKPRTRIEHHMFPFYSSKHKTLSSPLFSHGQQGFYRETKNVSLLSLFLPLGSSKKKETEHQFSGNKTTSSLLLSLSWSQQKRKKEKKSSLSVSFCLG